MQTENSNTSLNLDKASFTFFENGQMGFLREDLTIQPVTHEPPASAS